MPAENPPGVNVARKDDQPSPIIHHLSTEDLTVFLTEHTNYPDISALLSNGYTPLQCAYRPDYSPPIRSLGFAIILDMNGNNIGLYHRITDDGLEFWDIYHQ